MPSAVVVGAGPAGLAAALGLHQHGWEVVLLEGSRPLPDVPASEASRVWSRPSVPQAQHSHTLTSLGVRTLRRRAPEVLDALRVNGAELFDLTAVMPPDAALPAGRPDDEDLFALGCRRTTFEFVLHRFVAALPRVRIRYQTRVKGVTVARCEPSVDGVVTEAGERVPADVVIDATGRRAAARGWLYAAGHPVGEDLTSPSGVAAYTRFYRLARPAWPGPLNRGHAAGDVFDHYAGVLHPGDGGTFSIAIGTLPGDRELAALSTAAGFTAAARATPWLGPWLSDGVSVPISPIRVMTCPPNALRAAATSPVLAGLYPVGDAACVTNPLFGRGMSLALAHGFDLADLLTAYPVPDKAQADAAAELAEAVYRPWYEHSASADRARIARWRASAAGTEDAPDTRFSPDAPSPARPSPRAVAAAATTDAAVWRGMTRMAMTLSTPGEVFADEDFTTRVARATAVTTPADARPPTRAQLVNAVIRKGISTAPTTSSATTAPTISPVSAGSRAPSGMGES